jgi:hypothetical protein
VERAGAPDSVALAVFELPAADSADVLGSFVAPQLTASQRSGQHLSVTALSTAQNSLSPSSTTPSSTTDSAAAQSTAARSPAAQAVAPLTPGPRRDTLATSASGIPSYLRSSASTVVLADVAKLSRIPLLRQLGQLRAADLGRFVTEHPEAITQLLAAPPAPAEVTAWWMSLDEHATTVLCTGAKQLVGNLDGIPTPVRDRANQAWLDELLAENTTLARSGADLGEVMTAERKVHMLGEVARALGTAESVPERRLLTVDAEGQGRAAVVLGDLATADYVTYLVPGMFFTIDGQINDWTDDAARIYDEQVSWLSLIGEMEEGEAAKSVAVVAWMGYETPDLTSISSLELAGQGRDAIASAVEGLLAERAGNTPHIAIIAHSYGSTAALMALTEYDFEIDALAVVGSPGSGAQSVAELNVRDGNVFVGEAAWDPVANTAFFGSDPGSAGYGAHSLNVDGGVDQITNDVLTASIGHNGYFTAGSESVRNLALIGIGQEKLVTDGSTNDDEKTLALLR